MNLISSSDTTKRLMACIADPCAAANCSLVVGFQIAWSMLCPAALATVTAVCWLRGSLRIFAAKLSYIRRFLRLENHSPTKDLNAASGPAHVGSVVVPAARAALLTVALRAFSARVSL